MERRPLADRRQAPRTSMISGGSFVSRGTSQGCVIVNLSRVGVRIHLLAEGEAPETLMLHLPGGVVRAARRRWQHDAEVGFEFVEPLPDDRNEAGPTAC